MEYWASLEQLAPSTINVRLSAIRRMVGEARKNGMIGTEEAAHLTRDPEHPHSPQYPNFLEVPKSGFAHSLMSTQ
jgi:hypothetical protein